MTLAPLRRFAVGLAAVPLLLGSCEPQCAPAPPGPPRILEQRQLGTSFEGRPIVAYRLGTPGATPVLAVGSIHGDEEAGIEIVEHLRDAAAIPAGLDVWIVPTINPDGNVHGFRTNVRGVDLNRNFPTNWAFVDCRALPRNCAGYEPLGEPESRAFADFVTSVRPQLTIMYHGADHVVSAATAIVASPAAVLAYADVSGYPLGSIPCSPACTGTATQFTNATVSPSTAFTVELSTKAAGGMTPAGVSAHAAAFWAAAARV
jgi:murein peptide amidase A